MATTERRAPARPADGGVGTVAAVDPAAPTPAVGGGPVGPLAASNAVAPM